MEPTLIKMNCESRNNLSRSESRESAEYGEESIEAEIEIEINTIENLIEKDNPLLKIVAEHNDIILGSSQDIFIDTTCKKIHPINFKFEIVFLLHDLKSIAPIVSSPVLVKVYEIVRTKIEPIPSPNGKGKGKKDKIVNNQSIETKIEEVLIGLCNIDLLPMVLGETIIDEMLILESPSSYSWDENIVPWANLPRLSITMRRDDYEFIPNNEYFNILNITVESIYNLPMFFNENMEYKCATVIRTDNNVQDSRIIFGRGKWTDFRDVEQTKSWRILNLDSRAKFSKYRISCDCDDVKSAFKQKFDLKSVIKRDVRKIEWNSMNRCLLDSEDVDNILDRLKKQKCWPFEIMVTEKIEDNDKKEEADEDIFTTVIYQCFVDISQLLFPGLTKTRVLAQLHTQSPSVMKEKTGLSTSIFDEDLLDLSDEKICESEERSYECESQPDVESIPLFTECGKPVLILIEFELYRPFIPARVLEDYTDAIENLKKQPKAEGALFAYTPDLVHDQYIDCIKELIDVLGESYRDFIEKCECKVSDSSKSCECLDRMSKANENESLNINPNDDDEVKCPYAYIQDELSGFKQYLHETGKYVCIRSELKNKIINLLDQKFSLDSPDWYSAKNQNFIATSYTYLVEHMYEALNTKLDVRKYPQPVNDENFQELWFRAEEAYEFEDYDKAEKLFTKLVADDRKSPDVWIRYAAYSMKKCAFDDAMECCREAIELNSRHKAALLFYAILLTQKEEYTEAEIIFKSLLHLYPRFAEGWAVLHLFYKKIDYHPGIDLTLNTAEKCLQDRTRDIDYLSILNQEPIAWSTILCRKTRIFHLTAVLLLKLNLYDFACAALVQDICHHDRSVEALYFLGVCHYLRKDYNNAINYLEEAEAVIGLEYSIAALLGNSRFKLNDETRAIEHYEAIDMMYDRPDNVHLVHMRLGFQYIELNLYERARNIFLRASRYSPTCKTWLGLGAACYYLGNYEESEIALTEANRIDDEDPEVWAYFCLLSMALRRLNEFNQCYRQMVKNNLKSDKLWRLIKRAMDALGYSIPIIELAKKPNDFFQ